MSEQRERIYQYDPPQEAIVIIEKFDEQLLNHPAPMPENVKVTEEINVEKAEKKNRRRNGPKGPRRSNKV